MIYGEYVNHMLRVYFADIPPDDISQVGKLNCACCDKILRHVPQSELDILRRIYSQSGRIALKDAVRICAEQLGSSEDDIWRIVKIITKKIARDRGLI